MSWWRRLLDWLGGPRPVVPPTPLPPTPPPPAGDVAQALLMGHNVERAKAGLPPLKLDARLTAAAQGHARRMAAAGRMAHEGLGDGDPWSRIRAAGYAYAEASENLAEGGPVPVPSDRGDFDFRPWSPAEAVEAWMDDPPHRANVLGRWAHMGGASAADAAGNVYYCCDYGRP